MDNSQPSLSPLDFCVSAPSKALITSGYLVIDPQNQGIVISLDAHFHCEVKVTLKHE